MKNVKHYLKNGKVWSGNYHKMPNGMLHTNKSHTATSKPLYHYGDLSATAKKKAKGQQ